MSSKLARVHEDEPYGRDFHYGVSINTMVSGGRCDCILVANPWEASGDLLGRKSMPTLPMPEVDLKFSPSNRVQSR